ncbi:MAG: hypothetical protein IKJ97_01115 [Bacteroidaceae bacterium]|nr:hypothetical protein [Bacteroidaceae bacterium]
MAAYGVYGREKHNDTYSFDTMWGNGLPAPEGENEEEDMIFSLSVEKGSRTITVSFGAW